MIVIKTSYEGELDMIKTVIFDMDGLMFDTERLGDVCWHKAAEKMGVTMPKELLEEMRGMNREACNQVLINHFGESFPVDDLRKRKMDYTEKMLEEEGVPVKKGLCELLSFLKTHGYRTVLATSTSSSSALKLLKMADVEKYFDRMIFGNMVEHSKPDPEIFRLAVQKAYTKPEECLVLEDSPKGVEAAYRAGCRVFMIPDCVEPDEKTAGMAEKVLPSLEDVLANLKQKAAV